MLLLLSVFIFSTNQPTAEHPTYNSYQNARAQLTELADNHRNVKLDGEQFVKIFYNSDKQSADIVVRFKMGTFFLEDRESLKGNVIHSKTYDGKSLDLNFEVTEQGLVINKIISPFVLSVEAPAAVVQNGHSNDNFGKIVSLDNVQVKAQTFDNSFGQIASKDCVIIDAKEIIAGALKKEGDKTYSFNEKRSGFDRIDIPYEWYTPNGSYLYAERQIDCYCETYLHKLAMVFSGENLNIRKTAQAIEGIENCLDFCSIVGGAFWVNGYAEICADRIAYLQPRGEFPWGISDESPPQSWSGTVYMSEGKPHLLAGTRCINIGEHPWFHAGEQLVWYANYAFVNTFNGDGDKIETPKHTFPSPSNNMQIQIRDPHVDKNVHWVKLPDAIMQPPPMKNTFYPSNDSHFSLFGGNFGSRVQIAAARIQSHNPFAQMQAQQDLRQINYEMNTSPEGKGFAVTTALQALVTNFPVAPNLPKENRERDSRIVVPDNNLAGDFDSMETVSTTANPMEVTDQNASSPSSSSQEQGDTQQEEAPTTQEICQRNRSTGGRLPVDSFSKDRKTVVTSLVKQLITNEVCPRVAETACELAIDKFDASPERGQQVGNFGEAICRSVVKIAAKKKHRANPIRTIMAVGETVEEVIQVNKKLKNDKSVKNSD